MEWFFGIFPMMTIMAGLIGAIMGVRLVYIDREYGQIINQYEEHITEIESQLVDAARTPATQKSQSQHITEIESQLVDGQVDIDYLIVELKNNYGVVVKTKSDREDSRRRGIALDIIGLAGIIVLGLVAVFGVFAEILIMLVVLSAALFVAPVYHFLYHIMSITGRSIK